MRVFPTKNLPLKKSPPRKQSRRQLKKVLKTSQMFMKVETLSIFKIFTRNVLEIIGAEEVVANEETIAEETVEEAPEETVEGLIFS